MLFALCVSLPAFGSGLMGVNIEIGQTVRCEGWPDYDKDKSFKTKRFIEGEIIGEEGMDRITIYGKILNPLDKRDMSTVPFLLLKKMCLYRNEYLNAKYANIKNKVKLVKKIDNKTSDSNYEQFVDVINVPSEEVLLEESPSEDNTEETIPNKKDKLKIIDQDRNQELPLQEDNRYGATDDNEGIAFYQEKEVRLETTTEIDLVNNAHLSANVTRKFPPTMGVYKKSFIIEILISLIILSGFIMIHYFEPVLEKLSILLKKKGGIR